MILFLTSSPFVENTPGPIFSNANHFVDNLKEALPPCPRCLVVSSDPEDHHHTCQRGVEILFALADQGIYASSFQVLDNTTADFGAELVSQADFIVLCGGHVPTQNQFFQEIGLGEILEGFDGVIMGISAGSMNAPDVVYQQPEEPGESAPDFPRFAPGLGLTGVSILPHYQKVKNAILDGLRLFEDITYADSLGHTFFALPDGSYFYQDEEHLLLCGEAYRLKDGILELLTRDGDVLDMSLLEP